MQFFYNASRIIMVVALAAALAAPHAVLADGYSPLDLPERGDGPTPSVQGEQAENEQATPSATPENDEEGNLTGNIVEINEDFVVVEVGGVERQIELPDDVKVVRDGEEVAMSAIQPGDSATFERNDEGDITEVRVASAQAMDFWRGFLPILLVVLIGFFLLTRKRGDQKTI